MSLDAYMTTVVPTVNVSAQKAVLQPVLKDCYDESVDKFWLGPYVYKISTLTQVTKNWGLFSKYWVGE